MAFEFAHEADPNARLIYNDFSIAHINNKSNAVYNLVRNLQSRQVPIHGVGFQMHVSYYGLNYENFADNMRRFGELGLELYITELDVAIDPPITEEDYDWQAIVYRNIMDKCLQEPAFVAFQTWGFTDKYSWKPSNDALIFDRSYQPKPAYYALRERLWQPPSLDNDQDMDLHDFAVFASAWMSRVGDANYNRACELSRPADGMIDMRDLAFLTNWLSPHVESRDVPVAPWDARMPTDAP
jgi:hypothetical protein